MGKVNEYEDYEDDRLSDAFEELFRTLQKELPKQKKNDLGKLLEMERELTRRETE